ncbi:MAG: hypothetical protein AB7K86_11640 [Rhodospirillales bacterium]
MATMLVAAYFLPRFAVGLGERELPLTLVVTLICIALLLITGGLRLSTARLIGFAVAAACLIAAATFGQGLRVSASSFGQLLVLYACYAFVLADDADLHRRVLKVFRALALILAACGIVQFAAQFAVPGGQLFTFEGLVPDAILSKGWNTTIPMADGQAVFKANGFFLLEPSHFSQLMALALIVELLFFRLTWRVAVLGVALGLAFSGTGLAMLVIFGPLLLVRRGHAAPVLAALALGIALALFAGDLGLGSLFQRVGEFDDSYSSGFARFLSPFYLFEDFQLSSLAATLFGLGPGSIDNFFNALRYTVHDPTWGKLFFEYGLVGFVPLMSYVGYCLFAHARSGWLSAALFFQYLLLGGYLLDARLHPVILALAVFHNVPLRPRPAAMPVRA